LNQASSPTPVRGKNPEPETGWSWVLTDYEVAYVREFNARPPRLENWAGSERDETRLDDEAAGIRQPGKKLRPPQTRVSVSLFITTVSVILIAATAATVLAATNTMNAESFRRIAISLEEQIND
jgi:hypothetical protein